MRIAVIGAGAMGCLYAGMLSGRQEVTLFDIVRETVDTIRAEGILCREPDGRETRYSVSAMQNGESHEVYDLVILFVKDLYSRAALEANRTLIGTGTLLLSLQNGMGNEEIMQEFAPADRILLGTTKHNCVTLAPGKIYHSGAGITHIGSPVGNRAAAEQIAGMLAESGIETAFCDSVRHLLWEKLFVNMTINPLTALLNTTIGTLCTDTYLKNTARTLLTEAVAVAAAEGETFDADTVFDNLMRTVQTLASGKASMCQDLEKKRKTEIDFINGAVVRLGRKHGIPTPCHETVVNLIHAKENL